MVSLKLLLFIEGICGGGGKSPTEIFIQLISNFPIFIVCILARREGIINSWINYFHLKFALKKEEQKKIDTTKANISVMKKLSRHY